MIPQQLFSMVATRHMTCSPIRQRAVVAVLTAAFAIALSACSGNAPDGRVKYSVSAVQNYEKGQKEIEQKDWVAAAKYFSFIKARFPYSKYAVLAELRIADAELGAGHHLQAIDSYKLFKKLHPTHEQVASGYVNYRIGLAYTKMLPSDFWLVPPAHEKDQSTAVDASRELNSFLKKYPKSTYVPEAKKLRIKVTRRLASHEFYVARYYWGRGKNMGTVIRLRRLLERYSGVGFDADALWLLGKAYMREDFPDRAKKAWRQLVEQHPKHDKAGAAREALAKLSG
jgi:outer membrane protein assembly factor BamD